MWRTISRATHSWAREASTSVTPSHEFWSKFRAFRETEGGITTECVAKNLFAVFSCWGLSRLFDVGDQERCDKLEERLKELRSQAGKETKHMK